MSKAQNTRHFILEKSFELIYLYGYQSTSIDKIIETTNVTKGAFYYHFKNKEAMGLAVIREIIFPRFKSNLISPLEQPDAGIDAIYQAAETFMLQIPQEQIINGCPTNNMVQEMAGLNSKFREALKGVLQEWKNAIEKCLTLSYEKGQIGQHDFSSVAQFIIVSYEGNRGIGKLHQDRAFYRSYLTQLRHYLNSL